MTKRFLSGRRGKWVLWAGLVLWLAFLVEYRDVLQGHEIISLDYVSRLQPAQDPEHFRIVFVSIDAEDFKGYFQSNSPLLPEQVIETVREIACAGPMVLAVALDTTDFRYHNLQSKLVCPQGGAAPPEKPAPIVWAREARPPGEISGSHKTFPPNTAVIPGVVLGGAETPEEPSSAGVSNLFLDDGAVRRYKWIFRTNDDRYVDSLSLAVLKVACAKGISQSFPKSCQLLDRCNDPERRLNPAFIRFSMGPPHHVFSVRDLETLAHAKTTSAKGNSDQGWKENLKGKIVFLGGEFPQGYDRYRTAVGDQYGVRIHAEALASQLAGETIWVASRWIVIPSEILALCCLFFFQHHIKKPARRFWSILSGTLVLSGCLSFVAFRNGLFFLNFVPLLGGIFLDVIKDLAADELSVVDHEKGRLAAEL